MLSAGLLEFGPALQSNLIAIPESADHQYIRKLDTGLGSGLYQVKAEGRGDIPAFGEILSMPEALQDVKVAGSAEEDDVFVYKKGQSFKVAWKSPSIENAGNISLLDIFADSATDKVQVHCIGYESDLGVPGGRYWDVPPSIMSQLPVTKDAQLFLGRAHVRQAKKDAFVVAFQGIRSYFQNMGIE